MNRLDNNSASGVRAIPHISEFGKDCTFYGDGSHLTREESRVSSLFKEIRPQEEHSAEAKDGLETKVDSARRFFMKSYLKHPPLNLNMMAAHVIMSEDNSLLYFHENACEKHQQLDLAPNVMSRIIILQEDIPAAPDGAQFPCLSLPIEELRDKSSGVLLKHHYLKHLIYRIMNCYEIVNYFRHHKDVFKEFVFIPESKGALINIESKSVNDEESVLQNAHLALATRFFAKKKDTGEIFEIFSRHITELANTTTKAMKTVNEIDSHIENLKLKKGWTVRHEFLKIIQASIDDEMLSDDEIVHQIIKLFRDALTYIGSSPRDYPVSVVPNLANQLNTTNTIKFTSNKLEGFMLWHKRNDVKAPPKTPFQYYYHQEGSPLDKLNAMYAFVLNEDYAIKKVPTSEQLKIWSDQLKAERVQSKQARKIKAKAQQLESEQEALKEVSRANEALAQLRESLKTMEEKKSEIHILLEETVKAQIAYQQDHEKIMKTIQELEQEKIKEYNNQLEQKRAMELLYQQNEAHIHSLYLEKRLIAMNQLFCNPQIQYLFQVNTPQSEWGNPQFIEMFLQFHFLSYYVDADERAKNEARAQVESSQQNKRSINAFRLRNDLISQLIEANAAKLDDAFHALDKLKKDHSTVGEKRMKYETTLVDLEAKINDAQLQLEKQEQEYKDAVLRCSAKKISINE